MMARGAGYCRAKIGKWFKAYEADDEALSEAERAVLMRLRPGSIHDFDVTHVGR